MERYAYDAYGRLTYATAWNGTATVGVVDGDFNGDGTIDVGASADGFFDKEYFARSSIGNEILFQGRRYDFETKFYYFRNRYYDPEHGRFISRDPSGPVDGPNLYAFVNNNPINYVDPMGLMSADDQDELGARLSGTGDHAKTDEEKKISKEVEFDKDKANIPKDAIVLDMKIILWDGIGKEGKTGDRAMAAIIDSCSGGSGYSHVSCMFKIKYKEKVKDKNGKEVEVEVEVIRWVRIEAKSYGVTHHIQKEGADLGAQFKAGLCRGKRPVIGKDEKEKDILRGYDEIDYETIKSKIPALKDTDMQRIYEEMCKEVGNGYDFNSFTSRTSGDCDPATVDERTVCSELFPDALDRLGIDTSGMRSGLGKWCTSGSFADFFEMRSSRIPDASRKRRKLTSAALYVPLQGVAATCHVGRFINHRIFSIFRKKKKTEAKDESGR